MRIAYEGRLDGLENMRRDAALLESAGEGLPSCRVYGWEGLWVSVGRFQSANSDLVDPIRTRWVRRPTGGKAVLHGHDITVGLALPLGLLSGADPRSVKSAYRLAVQPVIAALRRCGHDAMLAADSRHGNRGVQSGDCFAFASPNDVVDASTGQKLCGCALRLTDRAVLLQASIPSTAPLVEPDSVIVGAKSMVLLHLQEEIFTKELEAAWSSVFKQ